MRRDERPAESASLMSMPGRLLAASAEKWDQRPSATVDASITQRAQISGLTVSARRCHHLRFRSCYDRMPSRLTVCGAYTGF